MLKARMETTPSDRKVSTGGLSSLTVEEEGDEDHNESGPNGVAGSKDASLTRPSTSTTNALGGGGGGPRMFTHQFSDRDGIVWCSCCEGDLIVI